MSFQEILKFYVTLEQNFEVLETFSNFPRKHSKFFISNFQRLKSNLEKIKHSKDLQKNFFINYITKLFKKSSKRFIKNI